MAQMVKRVPAMRETRVQFLGREDPLEKEMAIHSSTLAWKIPRMEEPWDRKESDSTERLHFRWWFGWFPKVSFTRSLKEGTCLEIGSWHV